MDRSVGIDADHQNVACQPCLAQVAQMTDMEQVEDAVGEHHPGATLPSPVQRGTKRYQIENGARQQRILAEG